MTDVNTDRRAVRNAIAILLAIQVSLLAWILVDSSRPNEPADPQLNMLLFLVACGEILLIGRLTLGTNFRALRRGLEALSVAAASVSVVSLSVVDYGSMKKAGPVLPAIMVVITTVSFFRARR